MSESPQVRLWWQTGVIYQIYPRSFQDTNRDGIGDLVGIIRRLPYVRETLGADAIWLSPFYPSPMKDLGYDVSNYVDVDPIFGTLEDFDALVEEAHRVGLKVIVDFVPNHTSDQHPWFLESRSSRDNPRRDWFTWRDPQPDGSPPNNWLSVFGGKAWEWDEPTQQFYLHRFLKEQPDLNWWNPAVREAMFDVIRFWLERGVDGFRIDVAHGILKDPDLRDNPANLSAERAYKNMGDWDTQIHTYDEGHEAVHDIYRDLRRLLDSYSAERPRMLIGEIHIFDYDRWSTYFGVGDEIHLPFNFGLIGAWQATRIRTVVDAVEGVMRPGAWPTYVLGNHDEHRIASRVGPDQARVAQMLLLTLRGTPTMYYGDELGMLDVPIAPEDVADPWEKGASGLGLGRDPERTPMRWDGSPNAGFTDPDVTPWLPIGEGVQEINVANELRDERSMLNLTRALLAIRSDSLALQVGAYHPLETRGPCFVYTREFGTERKLIALNFSDGPLEVDVGHLGSVRLQLSTWLDGDERDIGPTLRLRPNEGILADISEAVTQDISVPESK